MQGRKLGLALGSGAARGLAHIGVLQALTTHHIPVSAIAGSSMGSLVGALYASGIPPKYMEGLACALRFRHWVDFTVPKMGLISGERIREMVALLTRNEMIEDLPVPLAIVATELLGRKSVTFRAGNAADAVRASISIPGIFVPFVMNGGIFVDGGVLDRVPVEAAYNLGADFVIAVDVGSGRSDYKPESMIDVIVQSLDVMQDFGTGQSTRADITIVPELDDIGPSQFHKAKQAIDAGYEAVMKVMEQLRGVVREVKSDIEDEGNHSAVLHERSRTDE
jgi:NTE family protein